MSIQASNKYTSSTPLPFKSVASEERMRTEKIRILVKKIFYFCVIPFNLLLGWATQAVSDFLGLRTLRHGTCMTSYLNIRATCVNTKYGRTNIGALAGMNSKQLTDPDAHNRFYVAKDRTSDFSNPISLYPPSILGVFGLHSKVSDFVCLKFQHLIYQSLASFGPRRGFIHVIFGVIRVVLNLTFTPVLKIRMEQSKMENLFENDPLSGNFALRTKKSETPRMIGTEYIGLQGVFRQGAKEGIWKRMRENPGQVCWGLAWIIINPIAIVLLASFGIYLAARSVFGCREKAFTPQIERENFSSPAFAGR